LSKTLKLYHTSGSPNSRRVRMFLAGKELGVTMVPVDLGKGEQHSESYRLVNPRQMVPTLVLDDGTAIGEVLAIWRYLEETLPAKPLFGVGPTEKALVTMWERRMELEGFAPVMEGLRNTAPVLKGRAIAGPYDYEQIPQLAERNKLQVKNFLDGLDARLADVPFVAGPRFSAADITALATIDFAKGLVISIPDNHRASARWYEDVSGLPSAAA
jgi:glutathione S-transferase